MPPSKSSSYSPADTAASGRLITGGADYVHCALDMIASARREIALLSYNLDPRLYNRPDMESALKDFILLSPRSSLRILLRDESVAARGHRVVDMGQTLTSFVEFRTLGERQQEIQADCLIIDENKILERRTPDSLDARYYSNQPALVRGKRRQFDEWWQAGDPASALRRLHFG